jgi:hypothetical protein
MSTACHLPRAPIGSGLNFRSSTDAFLLSLAFFFLPASLAMADDMKLEPSGALACLTLLPEAATQVVYPAHLLEGKTSANVEIELEFRGADRAPTVKILNKVYYSAFIDAIETYVGQLRVPCMKENQAPVTLRQTYVFDPVGGRTVRAPVALDLSDEKPKTELKCLAHTEHRLLPQYPEGAFNAKEVGNFLLQLRFFAPDQAPVADVFGLPENTHLRAAVVSYAKGLRLPCMTDGPISSSIVYVFLGARETKFVLRDTTLRTLLGNAKDLSLPAKFDFNAMNCPFEFQLTYYHPFKKNVVNELDNSHPNRRPFLAWISGLSLNLDAVDANGVLGESMTVSVPCGSLDL